MCVLKNKTIYAAGLFCIVSSVGIPKPHLLIDAKFSLTKPGSIPFLKYE